MGLLLVIILVLLLFGGLPRWGYHSYGYAPSGFLVTTFGDRKSIVFGRFAPAITSRSRKDFSIGNDLSWRISSKENSWSQITYGGFL